VSVEKAGRWGGVFFWPGALLLLPHVPFVFRERRMRLLIVTTFVCGVGFLAVVWSQPHYAAPLTCVVYALMVQALRHLRTMRLNGQPVGMAMSRALVIVLVLDTGMNVAGRVCDPLGWACAEDTSRATLMERLMHMPGRHLIVVRYSEHHDIHDEWVHNGADIDGAKVLWARELDRAQNAKLFAYFVGRHIWLAEPDVDDTKVVPYMARSQ